MYRYILFDADHTLFSFNTKAGLMHMLSSYQVDFNDEDYDFYQTTNKKLWDEYQSGLINASHLQVSRFTHLSGQLDVPAQQLNDEFLDAMGLICEPLPGAIN